MELGFSEIKSFFLDCVKDLGCESNQIHVQDLDIACRCPVCGDSRTRKNLKRLHLYQKGEVINVNCFNGDCAVKNMTPYRFFQTFNPRIFEQFKNYSRKKYLAQIVSEPKKTELESISADFSLESDNPTKVAISNSPETEDSANPQDEVQAMISKFHFSGDDEVDMQAFKALVQAIKAKGIAHFDYFKEILNS